MYMINIFLYLHKLFYGANELNHYKRSCKVKWLVCLISFITVKVTFFYYMKLRERFGLLPALRGQKNDSIIVSLTSFPARVNDVWMVVDSICRQKMLPASINLYLCEEEFPQKKVPSNLERYEKLGLKIIWVDKNLKPHLKYYYALRDNPQKYVITIDDDIYYRDDLISRLWGMSQLNPGVICATRATKILNDKLELGIYNQWGRGQSEPIGTSFNYLALGTFGVIYPPGVFENSGLFNDESIVRNCLKADDLWLKCHEILCEIPVATGSFYTQSIEIMGSQMVSLRSSNCCETEKGGNDVQWENLDYEYGTNKKLVDLVKKEM